MKIKLSEFIADFLIENGIEHIFTVTGGGAMHLNDALGHKKGLKSIYNHHEQASAIAAEGYARLTGKIAAVCVTSGPGGTNAITGVLGGWLDSIPMFILSGQVKRETTIYSTNIPLRQLGDQEYDIVKSVKPMTKYAEIILEPNDIKYHLQKALFLALNGRPGPVWLDIPLDVQASMIETENLKEFDCASFYDEINPVYDENNTALILKKIMEAKRPVILAGTGIRVAGAFEEFNKLVEKLEIPVVTAWNAHDLLATDSPYFCGKPGTVGDRGGNFVVQSSDLLISLGCRMNIRIISYNKFDFAKDAYKIAVDIDKNELIKPTLNIDFPINANVKDVINSILKSSYSKNLTHQKWLEWCRNINKKYPVTLKEYYRSGIPLNPYVFVTELFERLNKDDTVVCGNGAACVITFQAAKLKRGQRLFTNSGCAAMGYGFPAAIGAAVAKKGDRVICVDGDGSFQMNIQELQTVVYNKLNIKVFYINNNGYHSIRQTQTNLFNNRSLVGVCDGNGLSFPDIEKIAKAYGISYEKIDRIDDISKKIDKVLNSVGPLLCEVVVDSKQNFEPKLSSKVLDDGKIISPELDDMFPFLDKNEYAEIKRTAKEI